MKQNSSLTRMPLALTLAFLAYGCAHKPKSSEAASDNAVSSNPHKPRINSIGTQSILTFDRSISKDVIEGIVIPIEGFGLGEKDRRLHLQVSGTVPLTSEDYLWRPSEHASSTPPKPPLPDLAEIVLKGGYVKRLRTGDRIEVTVGLQRELKAAGPFQKPEITLAYAQRTFTLYELEDYRKTVIPARILPHDIQAFPLPEEEAKFLFGGPVARSYFVVRLTLRNSQGEDKLVNSGLISATGRAIVVPPGKDGVTYTVPVKVSPQGAVQVFAVLDDREKWQPRAWTIRGLEFIGALATAGVNSFKVASEYRKYTSIYTGIFVPEVRKLWPDSWPGYKSNLVAFSMPELTKVPRQSTTAPKFLFFAKRDLELIVSDPALFESSAGLPFFGKQVVAPRGPEVRVISLAFDNLEVPFENVSAPGTEDNVEFLGRVQTRTEAVLEHLRALDERWGAGRYLTSEVTFDDLAKAVEELNKLNAKPETELREANLLPDVKSLGWLANELLKAKNGGVLRDVLFRDTGLDGYGLRTIAARREELIVLMRRALADSQARPLRERLEAIQKSVGQAESLLQFVHTAAEVLTTKSFVKAISTLATELPKSATESKERTDVRHAYATLRNLLTVPVLKDFATNAESSPPPTP